MDWNCIKCGVQNEAVHSFCWNCGIKDSIELSSKSTELKEFLAYVIPQEKDAILKSKALIVLVGLLFLANFLIARSFGCLFSIPLMLLVGSLILATRRRARRFKINPHQRLLEDKRPPILYLRPFQADVDSELVRSNETLEELLVSVLDEIGPPVAVGVPGEDLPALGAIRLHFPHREWQGKVRTLMSISQLVVIQAGFTEGVEWELTTSLRLLNPKRVVISFLSWQAINPNRCQSNYEVFLMLAERAFGKKYDLFPKHIGNGYFMYFDDEWVPSLSALDLDRNKVTVNSIRSALEPIFRRFT